MSQSITKANKKLFKVAPELGRVADFLNQNEDKLPLEIRFAFGEFLRALDARVDLKTDIRRPQEKCNSAYQNLMLKIMDAKTSVPPGVLEGLKATGIYPRKFTDSLKKLTGMRFTLETRRVARAAQSPLWQSDIKSSEYTVRMYAGDFAHRRSTGLTVVGALMVAGVLMPGVRPISGSAHPPEQGRSRALIGKPNVVRSEPLVMAIEAAKKAEAAAQKAEADKAAAAQKAADEVAFAKAVAAQKAADEVAFAEAIAAQEAAKQKAEAQAQQAEQVAAANVPKVGSCANLPSGARSALNKWLDGEPLSGAEQGTVRNGLGTLGNPRVKAQVLNALGAGGHRTNPGVVADCAGR